MSQERYQEIQLFGGTKHGTSIHVATDLTFINIPPLVNQFIDPSGVETYAIHRTKSGDFIGIFNNVSHAKEASIEGILG